MVGPTGRAPRVSRVYGPDLMLRMAEEGARRGSTWYLYGGREGVASRLAERMSCLYPGLRILGCYCPPFRELTPEEDQAVVDRINLLRPDVVWIGLSTPKQERWMASHMGRISAPVMVGVGAAFDIHAETVRQAPRWIQHSGFEWAFRLAMEPKRLWRRYLTNNPAFVLRIVRHRPHLIREADLVLSE